MNCKFRIRVSSCSGWGQLLVCRIGYRWHFLGSKFYYGAFDIPIVRLANKVGSYCVVLNLLLRIGNPNHACSNARVTRICC